MKFPTDNRVARHYSAWFVDRDYKELIEIEYRYHFQGQFDLQANIRGIEYRFSDPVFFEALAQLLDNLPKSSSIGIMHHITLTDKTFAILEEWVYPFKEPNSQTVVYQLRLIIDSKVIETEQQWDFGTAAEQLRGKLGHDPYPRICYFCKYLIDDNEHGGTDLRHDQLYCFRDAPSILDQVMVVYPENLDNVRHLLSQGTADMDATHSCSAFTYRAAYRR